MVLTGVLVLLTSIVLQEVHGALIQPHIPMIKPPHILPPFHIHNHLHHPAHLTQHHIPNALCRTGLHHHHRIFRRSVDNDQMNETEKSSELNSRDEESKTHPETLPRITIEHNGKTLFETDKYLTGLERKDEVNSNVQQSSASSPLYSNNQPLLYLNINGQPMPIYPNFPGRTIYPELNPFQQNSNIQASQVTNTPQDQTNISPQVNQQIPNGQLFMQNPFFQYGTPGYNQMSYIPAPLLGRGLFSPQPYPYPNLLQYHLQGGSSTAQPSSTSSSKNAPCPDLYRKLPVLSTPRSNVLKIISPNKFMDTLDHYLYPYIFN